MCCIHKYWDGSVVTEGIWFCITGIHVSTFTGGKKLVESLGACPCSRAGLSALHVSIQMTMSTGGKPILHTHTSFPEIWGCLYKNTCQTSTNFKGPWISNFRGTFHIFVKNFIMPMKKSETDVFQRPWRRQFTEWDSEEKFWSQVFGKTQEEQDVRSYSITQYSIDQIVNSIF